MTTCETCAHWRFDADTELTPAPNDEDDWDYITTVHERNGRRFGGCRMARRGYFVMTRREEPVNEEVLAGIKAYVMDGSGYSAGFYTEANFGCTEWERS